MHIPNCAWPQGQGIGLEGPGPQGPGRPMSGYPDILLVSNQILSLNTIFNTLFIKGNVCVCLSVCSLQKSKPIGWIGMKFCTEVVLKGRKVLRGFRLGTPTPPWVQGASEASTICFGKNFIKQKLQGAPELVGAGHLFKPQIQIQKDLGPMSFWCHGYSL